MKSKILRTVIAAVLMLTLAVMCMPAAAAIDYSGDCGEGLTWRYSEETGELKIEGTGSLEDYEYREVPWIDFVDDIKKVTVCEGVDYVSKEAFSCLESMEEISFPSTVGNYIGEGFIHNNNCKKITVAEGNKNNSTDANGVLYDKDKTNLVAYPSGSDAAAFTVPLSVKDICDKAFFCADALKTVTLPDGLLTIGVMAFSNTELLEKIEIPDTVIEIGYSAFEDSGISSVKISKSLNRIDENMFFNCLNLESVIIPDGVKVIDRGVFWDCEKLKTVTIPESVTQIDASAFRDCNVTINYKGSQADWSKISITDENDFGTESFKALKVNYDFKAEAENTTTQKTEQNEMTSAQKTENDETQSEKGTGNKIIVIIAIVGVSVVVVAAIIAIVVISKSKNKKREYK